MRRVFENFTRKFGTVLSALGIVVAMAACSDSVGLGEQVDTKAPEIEITYPPIAATIRGSFIIYGTWKDDKAVSKIVVNVKDTANKNEIVYTTSATVNQDKTWQVELNEFAADNQEYYNGYQFKDGNYEIEAIAYDAAGHETKTNKTYEIDNTAPFFVISNPGVVKRLGKDPSKYGSIFTIEGTIAEAHTVSEMSVQIYDADTSNPINAECYIENDIATAGGSSVTIAAFNSYDKNNSPTTQKNRYSEIYGTNDKAGTKKYYCTVELFDSAKRYHDPTETKESRSAEDEKGNPTKDLYLYDEIFSSLVSPKKGMGYSYAELMNIYNKTLVVDNSEKVLSVLNEARRNTQTEDNRLYFSLNPLANPTYTVNGFEYNFGSTSTVQTASAGNSLSITVKAGLDGTNVAPETLKVWLYTYDKYDQNGQKKKPSEEDKSLIEESVSKLEAAVKAKEAEDSPEFILYDFTPNSPSGTDIDGWKLIYENSSYNGSSVNNSTFSVTIPQNSVSLGKYYFVALTGADAEDVPFAVQAQKTIFGFEGNEAGVAPNVEIKTPENLSIIKSSDELVFTGRAFLSSGSLYISKLKATVSVKDEITNQNVGDDLVVELTRTSNDENWPSKNGFSVTTGTGDDADKYVWTVNPSGITGYDAVKAEEKSGKSYLYTLNLYGEASSGHHIDVSSMVHIDTTAPKVEITSVTPTLEGKDFYGASNTNTYLNGNVSLKANIEETNLKEVTYDILAKTTETTEDATSILSVLGLDGNFGKVYSAFLDVPTIKITNHFKTDSEQDPAIELEFVVKAEDSAGNIGETKTKKFIVKQETDKPQIELNNADLSYNVDSETKSLAAGLGNDANSANINSKHNLFGVTNNNVLQATITDDDGLRNVIVTLFEENLEDGKLKVFGTPYEEDGINKTSYTLKYSLPTKEGKYRAKIEVTDNVNLESPLNAIPEFNKNTTNEFWIAVDSGAPTLTVTSPSNGSFVGQGNEINVSGTVSKKVGVTISGFLYKTGDASKTKLADLTSIDIASTARNDVYDWTGKFTMPSDADGSYKLTVNVEDSYGQKGSLDVNLDVDITPPSLEISNITSDIANLITNKLITEENPNYKADGYEHSDGSKSSGYMVSGKWGDGQTGTDKLYFQFTTDGTWPSEPKATDDATADYANNIREVAGVAQSTGNSSFSFYVPLVEGDNVAIRVWAVDGAGNSTTPQEGTTMFSNLKVDLNQPVVKLYKDVDLTNEITGNSEELRNVSEFYAKFVDTNIPATANAAFTTKTISQGTLTVESFTNGVAKFNVSDVTDETSVTVTLQGTDTRTRKSSERKLLISEDKTAPRVTLGTYDKNLRSTSLELSGKVTDANFSTGSGYFVVKLIPTVSRKDTKTGNLSFAKSGNDYTWTANFNGLDDVDYDIAIEAKDTFDNKSAYSTKTGYVAENGATVSSIGNGSFSIDTKAPDSTIKISSHKAANPKLLNSAKGVVNAVDNVYSLDFGKTYYTNGKFTLNGVITENNLVTAGDNKVKFTVSREGAAAEEKTLTFADDKRTWSYAIPDSDTDGSYEYKLVLNDTAGNTFEKSVTVVVDTAKPTITFTSPANEESFESAPTAKVAFSDDGVGIKDVTVVVKDITGTEKTLEQGTDYEFTKGSATGTLNFKSDFDSEGTFTIDVSATDHLGFESVSSADTKRTIFYDKNKPTVTETSVGNSTLTTNAGEITLSGTVSDTNALFTDDSEIVKISATVGTKEKSWSATITEKNGKSAKWTYTFVTDKKDGVDKSAVNYLPDGNYTFTIVAKDTAKKTSQVSRSVNIDTVAPKFGTSNDYSSETYAPYVVTSGKTVELPSAQASDLASMDAGNGNVQVTWYNSSELRISGTASDENGTGIAIAYYETSTDGTNWSNKTEFAGTKKFNGNVSVTASGINGTRIRITVEDNAGNTNSSKILGPWNIDTTKPTLTDNSVKVGFAENPAEGSASFLANGEKDIYITGEISDEENGSGIDKVIILPSGSTSYDENTDKAVVAEGKFKFTIPNTKVTQSGSVVARIYDVAGNYNDVNLFSITLDNKAPDIKLNTPNDADTTVEGVDLNGVISLAGSSNDDYTIAAISKVVYSTADSVDKSTWANVADLMTSSYKVEGTYSFTVSNLDTTKLNDNTTYYFSAVGIDTAENIGYSPAIAVKVNQNSDRPVIKFTNIGSDAILKYEDGAAISGTISDDDDDGTTIVKEFFISSSQITDGTGFTKETSAPAGKDYIKIQSGETLYSHSVGEKKEYVKINLKTGDWTYYPADDSDGSHDMYFYVKDNADKIFDTSNTNEKNRPYYQIKSNAKQDNDEKFSYQSDSTPPEITGMKVAYSDDSNHSFVESDYKTLSTETYLGGTANRYAMFKVSAKDSCGIKELALTVGEQSITLSGSETSDVTETTWTSTTAFDVQSITEWQNKTVNITAIATAKDKSTMNGATKVTFAVDNSVDASNLRITSPAFSGSDTEKKSNETQYADITLMGTSNDGIGSGIESIKWGIPAAGTSEVADDGWHDEMDNDATNAAWSFSFLESASTQLSSFCKDSEYAVVADGSGSIYEIPVYFRIEDKLGNVAINKTYKVIYNKNADWPTARIVYPSNSEDATKPTTVGGNITVTGSAQDTKGTSNGIGVKKVYVQFATSVDSNGIPKWNGTDIQDLLTAGRTKATAAGDSSYNTIVKFTDSNKPANFVDVKGSDASLENWWGIEVEDTVSWRLDINKYEEFNPTEEMIANKQKRPIYIRVFAIDGDNKISLASKDDFVHVEFDSDSPRIGQHLTPQMVLCKENGTVTNSSDIIAKRAYASDMYLSSKYWDSASKTTKTGTWYLMTSAADDSGIKEIKLSEAIGGSSAQTKADSYITKVEKVYIEGSNKPSKDYDLYIPIYQTTDALVTYKLTVKEDSAEGKTADYTAKFNVDNTAPTIDELTSDTVKNSSSKAVKGNKLQNSNGKTTFGSDITDNGSGFEKLAVYFLKNGTIYNPYPTGTVAAWSKPTTSTVTSIATTGLSSEGDLYGTYANGSVSDNVLTTSTDLSSNKNIRVGGLAKVNGVYYQITAITGTAITLSGAPASGEVTNVFFPYAMVVQYSANWSNRESQTGSSDNYTVAEDDNDGIVQNVTISGAKATWSISVYSDAIEDGKVQVVCVPIDAAGNVGKGLKTDTMISNHEPRLSKVFLATDLNGDDKFDESEFAYTVTDAAGEEQTRYSYSALSDGKPTQFPSLATNKFAVKDKLALTMEYVGGNATDGTDEGYGSGAGTIRYIADINTTDLTTLNGNTTLIGTGKTLTAVASKAAITVGSSTNVTGTANAIVLANDTITSLAGYDSAMENGTSLTSQSVIRIALWDEISGTSGAVADSTDASGNVTYGNQYTVLNIPVYLDLSDDVAPNANIEPFYWKANAKAPVSTGAAGNLTTSDNSIVYYETASNVVIPVGHIDLGEDRNGGTNGSYVPAVSGVIKVEGVVSDDQRLGNVKVDFGSSSATIYYNSSKKVWGASGATANAPIGTLASDKYSLSMSEDKLTQSGHTAKWTLLLDTTLIENGRKVITVTTTQAKSAATEDNNINTVGTIQTKAGGKTAYCAVDVVPYITGIDRSGSSISGGTMNRSYFGSYPVSEGETITVYGFNFGTSGTWTVGSNNGAGTSYASSESTIEGPSSFTMIVPTRSGRLTVTANSVASENNSNKNTSAYNAETYSMSGTSTKFTSTDDRYLSVWNLGNYFNKTNGGVELQQPVMTADASGNLYASWAAQSNSNIMFSYGISNNVTPVFRCYDQPSIYSSVAFDTKSTSTTKGASVMFIPEHQGSGGTFSPNGISSTFIIGGTGVIQIKSTDIAGASGKGTKYGESNGLVVNVDGNPKLQLDGDNSSSYYSLESYDMNRRMGAFENPKAARFDKYLHNIWYDNVNESLHYSVMNTDNQSKFEQAAGAVNGWVVIDGGYSGKDRTHEFDSAAKSTADNGTSNPYNNKIDSHQRVHTTVYKPDLDGSNSRTAGLQSVYKTDLFLRPTKISTSNKLTNGDSATITNAARVVSCTTTTITLDNAPAITGTGLTPAIGDTIALMQNTSGDYKISFETITNISADKKTYTWENAVSHNIDSAAIYGGNMNVVGGNSNRNFNNFANTDGLQSSSAGSSAAIDVLSTGDKNGCPVVAYYDAENSKLKIAVASAVEPKLASNWSRQDTGMTCSGEVSMKIDGNNGIHIMYNNEDGQMCYLYGTYSNGSYTFGKEEVVDDNGSLSYGSISIIKTGTTYIPAMTYLNKANTANAVKYAYRTSAPTTNGEESSEHSEYWDYMIIPSLGSGHYALKENPISLESSNGWTSPTATVLQNQLSGVTGVSPKTATPATVESVIAYKTSNAYETAYLKKE